MTYRYTIVSTHSPMWFDSDTELTNQEVAQTWACRLNAIVTECWDTLRIFALKYNNDPSQTERFYRFEDQTIEE